MPACGRPTTIATISSASAATRRRREIPSVLHRFIDQLLYRLLDRLALRGRLLQQHEEHVVLAVDHEIAAAGAVPFQLAERAWRRRFGIARIGAHRKTEAETEAVTRKVEIV